MIAAWALEPPTGIVAIVVSKKGGDDAIPGGSAVIIARDGSAITLAEAIPAGKDVTVALSGGRRRSAQVLARDPETTAVLLRIADVPADVLPVECADSQRLRVLDPVWTAGNSAGAIEHDGSAALSLGVVSGLYDIPLGAPPARGRSGHELSAYRGSAIETDAAINDGNEGGALLDSAGRLVGLVSRGQLRERRLPIVIPLTRILAALGLPSATTAPSGGGERLRHTAERVSPSVALIYFERPNGLGNPPGTPRPPRTVAEASEVDRDRVTAWWEMYRHQQQIFFTDQAVTAIAVGDDLLLTAGSNLHGDAERGALLLASGNIPCSVIAQDLPLDLALVRCERPHGLPHAEFAVTAAELGQRVLLIGRHRNEQGWTATLGTISATERRLLQSRLAFLQTDARANYGSLGGPLVNDLGHVVGLCVKMGPIGDYPWLINSGVALAVDSVRISAALAVLRQGTTTKSPPILGLGVVLRERNQRMVIESVTAKTGAEKAGIQIGDEIVTVDQTKVASRNAISRILLRHKPGDTIQVEIRRGKEILTLGVELKEFRP